jgi:hypothetical protein
VSAGLRGRRRKGPRLSFETRDEALAHLKKVLHDTRGEAERMDTRASADKSPEIEKT